MVPWVLLLCAIRITVLSPLTTGQSASIFIAMNINIAYHPNSPLISLQLAEEEKEEILSSKW